jgi:hypothetical protein
MIRHLLFQSQSLYINSSLIAPDGEDGFLKAQFSPLWNERLHEVDLDAADMEQRANSAGVPLVVAFLPSRAEAAIASSGQWHAGYDPYKLDHELRSIIEKHGGLYLDTLPDFREIPNPEQYFLPVDGHPDARGHAIISEILAKELTSGVIPALKTAGSSNFALAGKR